MYLRAPFAETRREVLHTLVSSHPLGTFVATVGGEIVVNHIPFLLANEGRLGTLSAHVPRANEVWKSCDGSVSALIVFHGPDCYVSPSWYPSKQAHGRVVPTWNYAVVHVRGRPRAIEDGDWLQRHLAALTDAQEAAQPAPWKLGDAPSDFVDRMAAELVGIEVPIDTMIGQWKVSQNRPAADRAAVADALEIRGDDRALAMARLVRDALGAAAGSESDRTAGESSSRSP